MAGMVWWLFVASAGACDEDLSALGTALDEADRSLAELDSGRFGQAVDRAVAVVGCLREPVTPALAARLHRLVGVRAFGQRDALAEAAFAAARRIDPAYRLPPALFPPNSPLSVAWTSLPLESLRTEALPTPSSGWIALDGSPSTVRALDLPVVYQQVGWDGVLATSAYLRPGDPVPSIPVAPAERPLATDDHRVALVVTAAASGAAAAGFWGLAAHGRSRYVDLDDPVTDDRLNGLRTRTNVLAVGSVLGVGLCAVSGALLVASW